MIGRICQRDVDLAELHEPVRHAAERMHQRAVGSLMVLDKNKRPVGIITDRDMTIRVLAAGRDADATPVLEVMSPSPVSVREDESIETTLSRMRQGAFRRLPVVDRDGALVGIVALDDILALLIEEFCDIGALLARESPRAVVTERI